MDPDQLASKNSLFMIADQLASKNSLFSKHDIFGFSLVGVNIPTCDNC